MWPQRILLENLVAKTGLTLSMLRSLAGDFVKFVSRENARLSCEDFKRILCSKYPKLTDSDLLRRLFDVFDRDLDGSISFNEFVLGTATLLNGTIDEKLSLLLISMM